MPGVSAAGGSWYPPPMSTTGPADTAEDEFTVAQWAARPEDEPGELVDGRLVEEEMPDLVHETVVAWLFRVVQPWLRGRGGKLFGSEVRLQVSPSRGRKADVLGWFPGHPRLPGRGAVGVPPDLIVEVISPTAADDRRDRIDKADDYARFGVRWYWLIDPDARTLEICELADGSYVQALLASRGELDAVPGCPDLSLDLDALWAEVDELAIDPA
jgi:Uma2 family endonuclease